ncbi:urea ABC transporter permease subunit UrtC [Mesorhizobium sp. B2-7-3]|uniref:urea ABC transporter permease subunit UrtC n=1 Tax=Mesorhizobium sp. B2-7-3 TaxID=2589907 RepID=UPI00112B2D9B|nr:urea ABC transporter permease subunit UrtC [Mesorhizobium sp. B2-7-3]TPJ13068.1 urea ABC transporter permease subunit UrtC [Mesorhizobium sp. B2-7-3]
MISGRFFAAGADRRIAITIFILLAVAIIVPVLNLAVSPTSAFYIPSYIVALTGKYLCYALLALSLDLVWGYCGILSLGHGAFFALGGYAIGMYLMRQIGSRGVYGNPILPDFMVFLNYKELPWFWTGFDHFWFAAIMVLAVPGLLAFIFGWFAFRSRVTGVYLSIITQAMTYALLLAFFRNDMGFGGNNGLTDFKDILDFNVQADTTRSALFAASAVMLALAVFITWAIVGSKYGKLLMAVRDAESRTRFLGWRAENVKLFAFTVSAVMAGIAGALYVPQVGIINPGEFEPANSIEVVIWAAVGGRGTIVGPIIGALLVNAGKSWFTGVLPEFWLFALGGLFVAVTLLLPKGIIGMWDSWRGNARALRVASLAEEAGAEVGIASATSKPARSPARNPGEWSWSDPEPQAAE